MEQYTIYCTAEQTKKALILRAPIEHWGNTSNHITPTAEQMLGWLEEKGVKEVSVYGANDNKWRYDVWIEYGREPICSRSEGYISRKEATLNAIDAALDYLIGNIK